MEREIEKRKGVIEERKGERGDRRKRLKRRER